MNTNVERDERLLKTYRYLRIGMVGVVVALAVSILIERFEADCWQTSISSYHYTPVRAILVGGLMAIGVSLIAIKGDGRWEDTFFNFAGIMAPAVAVIPTADVGPCPSEMFSGEALSLANIDNNTKTLLIAGFLGLGVAALLAMLRDRSVLAPARVGTSALRLGLLATLVLLVVITVAYLRWDDFAVRGHGIAAVAMFVFLGAGIASNAHQRIGRPERRRYRQIYTVIVIAMAVAGLAIGLIPGEWDHRLLILESVEIALFVVFWITQTYEHWNETGLPAMPEPAGA